MRSILRSLLSVALLLSVAGCKWGDGDEPGVNERHVVILFTTDEHSQLFAGFPELDDFLTPPATAGTGALKGGVARRMTILKAQRDAAAARGAATLTLSSGDFSQGSLASAAWLATSPELAAMKLMGYDAVALGNHEFDLGAKALATAIQRAVVSTTDPTPQRPPLVLTNVTFSAASTADDDLEALYGEGKPIAPYRVLDTSNGLRIGIVSSMGVDAGTSAAAAATPVTFWTGATPEAQLGSVVAQLQAAVNQVRAQGVHAVILLGHAGIAKHPAGQGGTMLGEDELLAMQLQGVDLVLSGHTHQFTPQPRTMYASGSPVPVIQAKPYGGNVGKVELVFRDVNGTTRAWFDPSGTEFFEVDDRTLPTTDAAFVTDLQTRTIGFLEFGLDGPASTALPSFLEKTLTTITGTPVTANPVNPGSLWNKPLGQIDFDLIGVAKPPVNAPNETNMLNLNTDAIRAAVGAIAATEIGAQAYGPTRGDFLPGTTGAIAFGDVYHVVPLGGDPTVPAPADMSDPVALQSYLNAIPGYPLVRFNTPTAALRMVLEGTLQYSFINGDYFVGLSGLQVQYDLTRTPFDIDAVDLGNPATLVAPGWVTFMALDGGTVLYDVSNAACPFGFCVDPNALRSIATTLYVASFASAFNVPLLNDSGVLYASPAHAVVRRGDGSAIKDFEALGQYVAAACAGNGGFLPSTYDATTVEGAIPRRVVDCSGGCP